MPTPQHLLASKDDPEARNLHHWLFTDLTGKARTGALGYQAKNGDLHKSTQLVSASHAHPMPS